MYIDNHFQNTMYISTQSNQPKHEKPYKMEKHRSPSFRQLSNKISKCP